VSRVEDLDDETCVWGTPECGDVTMYDASGEPWCDNCRKRVQAEDIAAGLNDPERPLQ
jgi:hypothetical protein